MDIHEQMEKISISVTKNVAKAWETASQEVKNEISYVYNLFFYGHMESSHGI